MTKNIAFDILFDTMSHKINKLKIYTIGSVFWKKIQKIPLLQAISAS